MCCCKQTCLTAQALFVTNNLAGIQQQIELNARPVEKLTAQTRQTPACDLREPRACRQRRSWLRQKGERLRNAREHRGIAKMGFVQ